MGATCACLCWAAACAARQPFGPSPAPPSARVSRPAAEQALRQGYYHLGLRCARRPLATLATCLLLVAACSAGLRRLRCGGLGQLAAGAWMAEMDGCHHRVQLHPDATPASAACPALPTYPTPLTPTSHSLAPLPA